LGVKKLMGVLKSDYLSH